MESWLLSRRDQWVNFEALQTRVHFGAWEPIHTEVSLKFNVDEILKLAPAAGFETESLFGADSSGRPLQVEAESHTGYSIDFVDALWRAIPIKENGTRENGSNENRASADDDRDGIVRARPAEVH